MVPRRRTAPPCRGRLRPAWISCTAPECPELLGLDLEPGSRRTRRISTILVDTAVHGGWRQAAARPRSRSRRRSTIAPALRAIMVVFLAQRMDEQHVHLPLRACITARSNRQAP